MDIAERKRAYAKAHYEKHKQQYIDRAQRAQAQRTKQFKEWKNQQHCYICGETERVCLDFHHVHGKKDFELASSFRRVGWRKLLKELQKCVCVCANCHRKIHAKLINTPVVKLDITQLCES